MYMCYFKNIYQFKKSHFFRYQQQRAEESSDSFGTLCRIRSVKFGRSSSIMFRSSCSIDIIVRYGHLRTTQTNSLVCLSCFEENAMEFKVFFSIVEVVFVMIVVVVVVTVVVFVVLNFDKSNLIVVFLSFILLLQFIHSSNSPKAL